mgnify:CR=1 FL=1
MWEPLCRMALHRGQLGSSTYLASRVAGGQLGRMLTMRPGRLHHDSITRGDGAEAASAAAAAAAAAGAGGAGAGGAAGGAAGGGSGGEGEGQAAAEQAGGGAEGQERAAEETGIAAEAAAAAAGARSAPSVAPMPERPMALVLDMQVRRSHGWVSIERARVCMVHVKLDGRRGTLRFSWKGGLSFKQ